MPNIRQTFMDFSLMYQLKNKKSRFTGPFFYFALTLLIATIVCYMVFTIKMYLQQQKIDQLNQKMLAYGTTQQKLSEQHVLNYKKQIDDFTDILNNHTLSLNIFNFIQDNTIPSVWFSNLSVSEVKNEISLQGQTQTMETLSSQISMFEKNKDYIKSVNVVNSQVGKDGKIAFILKFEAYPKIFTDYASSPVQSSNISTTTLPALPINEIP